MQSYNEILQRMKESYLEESGHSADDVSDSAIRLKLLCGELYRLSAQIDYLRREAFPQTATGEYLDRHGEMRGITRIAAQKASGSISFSRYIPLSFDLVIPKGSACTSSGEDPVEYETTADVTLEAGSLTVSAEAVAVTAGKNGNAAAGYINTLRSPITGINYVTNTSAFTGGCDEESDDEYRARILAAYAEPSNGTNSGYYKALALSCDGICSACVEPQANGEGTVAVYVWGDGEAPSDSVITELSELYAEKREMGVSVSVSAAGEKTVNVSVAFKPADGADSDSIETAVTAALSAYFKTLSVGSAVYLTDLQRVILNAAPISKLSFASGMTDVAAAEDKIPVLGTVAYTVLS